MKIGESIKKILRLLFTPIRENALMFVFMYVLGLSCAYMTLDYGPKAHVYENLWFELLIDVYLLCLLLTFIPRKVRRWVSFVVAFVLYAVALIDVYCFEKFDSTLNPTMLMLVGETNSREAGEFLWSFLSPSVVFGNVGLVLLIAVLHILAACFGKKWLRKLQLPPLKADVCELGYAVCGLLLIVFVAIGLGDAIKNKQIMADLMGSSTIGEVEHKLTRAEKANFFTPIYRLIFSIRSNQLADQQINTLISTTKKITVDSCSYRSPCIVLIIGESYGKHHSQQYGYFMPTTPRQIAREKTGLLVKFSDVVTPFNLTSYVFKNVLSTHVIGEAGEWCDYPLFTQLFRKAGYEVSFITNQFLPKAKEQVYDFSGGFFLNNPVLSASQFDRRNAKLHAFDDGLLKDYDEIKDSLGEHNLIIFHLMGQHVNYSQRYPRVKRHFSADDYAETRADLPKKRRDILAKYDNATLYNDSIVDAICKRFEDKDAIVIYMPDHGEECYEGKRGMICRNHSAKVDYDLARYEFEIPFWIWCSHKYAVAHPDVFHDVMLAKDRRFMTDALPHLLLYLAGINTKYYHEEYNILSPNYNEKRKRVLKNYADYDKLRDEAMEKAKQKQ